MLFIGWVDRLIQTGRLLRIAIVLSTILSASISGGSGGSSSSSSRGDVGPVVILTFSIFTLSSCGCNSSGLGALATIVVVCVLATIVVTRDLATLLSCSYCSPRR